MGILNNLLHELIIVDSSTKSGANQIIEDCSQWLKSRDIEVERLENNGYEMLISEVGSGEKTLVLNGHVDVVSGKEQQFIPVIEDGKLYARGAADMKAGVAAIMCAIDELKNVDLNCKVQLQLVTDEEIGGRNCAAFLTESGYLGDFAICPEPTQLGIGIQAKGVLQMDVFIEGKPAHSSRPWEGENAIENAMNIFNQIVELPFAKESSEYFEFPSINLSKISAGEVYNKVPDLCKLSLDIRFLPSQTKGEIIKQIKDVTKSDIDIILYGEPVNNESDNPQIKRLIEKIKKHSKNADVPVFGQHGFADTRYFSRYNIPAIEFGPTGEDWHGDNEYVVLNSIETYKNIIVDFAKSI